MPDDAGNPSNLPERDNRGRFGQGNRFGRGNPFACYQAALRAEILEQETPARVKQVIAKLHDLAKDGDIDAAKIYLEHTVGKPRETPTDWLNLELPEHLGPGVFGAWQARIIEAMSAGQITVEQARQLIDMAEKSRKAYETDQLALEMQRMERELEEMRQE